MQSIKLLKNVNLNYFVKRFIKKEVRAKVKERRSVKKLALDYFDFYYAPIFGSEWNSMRLALLTGRKYTALVNNFGYYNETVDKLVKLGAFNLFEYSFKNFAKKENKIHDGPVMIPKNLKVFCFDNGDISEFPAPSFSPITRLSDYYCLDGGSVLSVIALDVKKDDYILDLCASPGGKTLTMLQTMMPKKIISTDISASRVERLNRMLREFIPKEDLEKLVETGFNTDSHPESQNQEHFDKVLIDVPCTNDRHSLFQAENNIFSKKRQDNRAELPNTQKELLIQGINACKTGGTIVYSTCTLSPLQNEAVIKSTLEHFTTENANFTLKIEPLDYLKELFDNYFTFSSSCTIGALVIPSILKNFGPLYICKITKISKM